MAAPLHSAVGADAALSNERVGSRSGGLQRFVDACLSTISLESVVHRRQTKGARWRAGRTKLHVSTFHAATIGLKRLMATGKGRGGPAAPQLPYNYPGPVQSSPGRASFRLPPADVGACSPQPHLSMCELID